MGRTSAWRPDLLIHPGQARRPPSPVRLALTARLASTGGAAPAGMIRVEPAVLEVPAGGSADATVTVDTNGDAPDEDYSGGVTAVAGDLQIVTPVAVAREVESYDLTLRARDRAGAPAVAFVIAVPRRRDARRAPGRVMLLPVVIERPPGAATPRIARITVEISFDDGVTWSRVPGVAAGDRWLGLVVHPAGAQFASLRGAAEDVDGRRNEVTIVRAYRVTAP